MVSATAISVTEMASHARGNTSCQRRHLAGRPCLTPWRGRRHRPGGLHETRRQPARILSRTGSSSPAVSRPNVASSDASPGSEPASLFSIESRACWSCALRLIADTSIACRSSGPPRPSPSIRCPAARHPSYDNYIVTRNIFARGAAGNSPGDQRPSRPPRSGNRTLERCWRVRCYRHSRHLAGTGHIAAARPGRGRQPARCCRRPRSARAAGRRRRSTSPGRGAAWCADPCRTRRRPGSANTAAPALPSAISRSPVTLGAGDRPSARGEPCTGAVRPCAGRD